VTGYNDEHVYRALGGDLDNAHDLVTRPMGDTFEIHVGAEYRDREHTFLLERESALELAIELLTWVAEEK
jgi:hypothetical protein